MPRKSRKPTKKRFFVAFAATAVRACPVLKVEVLSDFISSPFDWMTCRTGKRLPVLPGLKRWERRAGRCNHCTLRSMQRQRSFTLGVLVGIRGHGHHQDH